jgi:hypothetical protein
MSYNPYIKQELLDRINEIDIQKVGDTVVTKYRDRVLKVVQVSGRYEIFDIAKYLKDKIELIEKNFTITKYRFTLTRGVQYLELLSDSIEINGQKYHKSFYILNSSDKSRRLSFNAGLYCEDANFYIISNVKNVGLTKKHLKGVTQAAEVASEGLNGETFDEQVESLQSIVGHRVALSKIRQIILGEGEVTQIAHRKFDAFKNSIRWARTTNGITAEQSRLLSRSSEYIKSIEQADDFYIDAFSVLQSYLKIFNREDAHIIKNETERIMKITQCAIRNAALESIGI